MFTFGWLTVTPEDLAVWSKFPNASFTLVELPPTAEGDEGEVRADEIHADEFHLGTFDLPS